MKYLVLLLTLVSINAHAINCANLFKFPSAGEVTPSERAERIAKAQENFDRAALHLEKGGSDWAPIPQQIIDKVDHIVQEYHREFALSLDPLSSSPQIINSLHKAINSVIELQKYLVTSGLIRGSVREDILSGASDLLLMTKEKYEIEKTERVILANPTRYNTRLKLEIIRSEFMDSEFHYQVVRALHSANKTLTSFEE